jgi:hypothetical protein
LAQRSSGAAKDIKTLIAASGDEVKDGVRLVNAAGDALNEIVGQIKTVAHIVAEIAAASKEQAQGVEEINKAVSSMDEMTQQNSALVEENAAASRMLQDQAETMHGRMAFFKLANANDDKQSQADRFFTNPQPARQPSMRAPVTQVGNTALKLQHALRDTIESDAEWAEF